VKRTFRGVIYDITVRRLGPGNTVTVSMDGQAVLGTLLPIPPDGHKQVQVLAEIS